MTESFEIDDKEWRIEEALKVSRQRHSIHLSLRSDYRKKIQKGADLVRHYSDTQENVYGITTGFGASCSRAVPPQLISEVSTQLVRYHGCGLGNFLEPQMVRGVILIRLLTLAKGFSGVRVELLENMCRLLNANILPMIPEEGSVGASGDLTPLSYVAACLMGEREVLYQDKRMQAGEALQHGGIEPLTLAPKEGLALMNGTSVMTAIALEALTRAMHVGELSNICTALNILALKGNPEHLSDIIFKLKPFHGQNSAATRIRELISGTHYKPSLFQDPYSLRCAPHIIGVLFDALPWIRKSVETEMNSVTDNPIVDPEKEEVIHGGNFYGGHIAFAMDSLKNAVANISDLLDRQLALLVDSRTSQGLPSNLTGALGERETINHGCKALQISTSAWAAEALKLTMPASVFSRSTESHNQDKVSMGTIAARDCIRVLELSEQVIAASLFAGIQALWLRIRGAEIERSALHPTIQKVLNEVEKVSLPLTEDRALDNELRALLQLIRNQNISH